MVIELIFFIYFQLLSNLINMIFHSKFHVLESKQMIVYKLPIYTATSCDAKLFAASPH